MAARQFQPRGKLFLRIRRPRISKKVNTNLTSFTSLIFKRNFAFYAIYVVLGLKKTISCYSCISRTMDEHEDGRTITKESVLMPLKISLKPIGRFI